ncbi:MAG: cell division protein FtsQ [Oligoflexia bacterium]|nr:cell division protein FtsQ [Oligoflexia bacterium]
MQFISLITPFVGLFFIFSFFILDTSLVFSNVMPEISKELSNDMTRVLEKKVRFQTVFGNCPTRLIGNLTINLVEEFSKNFSLKDVKLKILNEGLAEKYFLSEYNIKYDPLKKQLYLGYDCPTPILKVSVYEKDKTQVYQAVLVENGKLLDPTYEMILKEENKLNTQLPMLSIPKSEVANEIPKNLAILVKKISSRFRENISELIISEDKELTIILSMDGNPISAFLGKDDWEQKVIQLKRIVEYLNTKQKKPSLINLSNRKKVVVKF